MHYSVAEHELGEENPGSCLSIWHPVLALGGCGTGLLGAFPKLNTVVSRGELLVKLSSLGGF